ncbi:hypothetical protein [Phytohabitans kaempferiae]|uniref:Uncharacterized protein n=1 Tax=Phytohabitans kaempferiae TaxID=1620943 RepID=A0ABV6M170_9ACTN
MTVDPYVDPHSGVLRNRLGIFDPERLREVEAGLTLGDNGLLRDLLDGLVAR